MGSTERNLLHVRKIPFRVFCQKTKKNHSIYFVFCLYFITFVFVIKIENNYGRIF